MWMAWPLKVDQKIDGGGKAYMRANLSLAVNEPMNFASTFKKYGYL
jgi:hypothetical protein